LNIFNITQRKNMSLDVRTLNGVYLQDCLFQGLPFVLSQYTTLNEKFNIQPSSVIAPGTYPTLGYLAIGNGGHQSVTGNGGIPLVSSLQHKATDNALFNHLPFVLRPVASDLTLLERENYALRKEITVNSQVYVAYYLKRILMTDITVTKQYVSVTGGVSTVTPYVATQLDLSPTPVQLVSGGVNAIAGDYLVCKSQLDVSFTQAECTELMSAAIILYGSDNYAIISEIAICSGVDKIISVTPSVGSPFNFTEAVGVQVVSFTSAYHLVKETSSGITKLLDVGTNEPLLTVSQG
jgi:hypothetical protein